jgi:hypothetical protein
LPAEQVKDAHERWFSINSKVNDRLQKEREIAKKQQVVEVDDDEADMTDIDKVFADFQQGPHMLELDFEPAGEIEEYTSVRTGLPTACWIWKHKLTGHEIRRYRNKSGKSWDTGKLSLYLHNLKESTHKQAFQRAQYILRLNKKNIRITDNEVIAVSVGKGEDKEELVRQWVSSLDV